jgi:hypothetical protein
MKGFLYFIGLTNRQHRIHAVGNFALVSRGYKQKADCMRDRINMVALNH